MGTGRTRWRFPHAATAAAVCVLLCLVGAGGLRAPVSIRARPASATGTRLSSAQKELDDVLARVRTATQERNRVERHLGALLAHLDETRRQVEATDAALVNGEIRRDQAQRAVSEQQRLVDQRATEAYTDPVSPIDVILGASSLDDLQNRVVYLGAIAKSDQQVASGLAERRHQLAVEVAATESLQRRLDASQASLEDDAATVTDGLFQQQQIVAALDQDVAQGRALVKNLKDKLAKEQAMAALQAASDPAVPPPLPGTRSVSSLIQRDFGPQGKTKVDQALCVAQHESGFDPNAVNASSGAAGVFQFLPSTWGAMSVAAGWQGSSVLDPDANVAVAAWTEGRYGWSPWVLDGPYCGF